MSFQLAEADRRLANIIEIGEMLEVDAASGRARCRIGDLETALIPWASMRAGPNHAWWPLEIGEWVIVAAPGGDLARAFILGSLPTGRHPAFGAEGVWRNSFADGSYIEHRNGTVTINATREVNVLVSGPVNIHASAAVNVLAPGDLNVTGNVNISGDVAITGKVAASDQITSAVLLGAPVVAGAGVQMSGGSLTAEKDVIAEGDVLADGISLKGHSHGGEAQ